MDKKESSEIGSHEEEEGTDISSLMPSGDASDLQGGVLSLSSVLEDQLQQGDRRSSGEKQTQEAGIFTEEAILGLIPSQKENLVMSEGKKAMIGPDGGKIKVGGCVVEFHVGCFQKRTNVYTKAEIDSSKWPPNFTGITAMFWVECQGLMTGASLKMTSWCMKVCAKSRRSHVFHRRNASQQWEVVANLPLTAEKVFHFDCSDFSPYVIGIFDDEVSTTDFVLKSHVYAGRGNFTLAFFLQHELIEKAIEREMAKWGLELQLNLAPIPVKMNDIITGNLRCMNKSFQFANECKKVFEIDTEFARLQKQAIFCTSVLTGSGEPNLQLPFEFEARKNEILVEEPQVFSYDWMPVKQVMQYQGTPKLTADITQVSTIKHLQSGGLSIDTGNTPGKRQRSEANTFPPIHGALESTKRKRNSKRVNENVTEPVISAQMAPVGGHEDRLTASESKNVMIGPDGGTVEVGGCAIIFPSGCFNDISKIFAKAEIDSSKWPPNYICIAAMLWVKSKKKLLRKASIKMKSWCVKEQGASDKTEAHILHHTKSSPTWDVIGTLALNDQKIFKFDCTDFCAYIIGIPESEFPLAKLVIDGHIYADKANTFTLAFFLQHQLILKFIKEEMTEQDRKRKLNFNTTKVEIDDRITAYLNCTNNDFRFPNEFRRSFKIDSDFVNLKRKTFFHSHLDGKSNRTQFVSFECGVDKNDTPADGPHDFCCEWIPMFKDQNEQQATMETEDEAPNKAEVIHHHNKYEATHMYFDGRNNKYNQRQHPAKDPKLKILFEGLRGGLRDLNILGSGNYHDDRHYPRNVLTDGRLLLLLLPLVVLLAAWAWTSH